MMLRRQYNVVPMDLAGATSDRHATQIAYQNARVGDDSDSDSDSSIEASRDTHEHRSPPRCKAARRTCPQRNNADK